VRKTITQIRDAGFSWPQHAAIEASAARVGEVIDLAQTLLNLEKAMAFHQRQLDEAYAFRQSARASGWVDADYDDFTSTRDDHAAQRLAHAAAIEHVQRIVAAFERAPATLRLRPAKPTTCGAYTLDALFVDQDLDFRLELGAGTMIYWALPVARNDRLRLVLVDSAVMAVDAELIEDPFVCDLELSWRGDLACLAEGDVTRVSIEITPRSYRFLLELGERVVERRWAVTSPE